jgi:phosphonate transport system substrate-binding protein
MPLSRRALAGLLAAAALAPRAAVAQGRAPRTSRDPGIAMPAAGERAWRAQVPLLRIGLNSGENEADRLARFGPYRALLEETFKVPTRLFPAADYAGVIQGLAARQLDMAATGPSAYASAWIETRGNVEPILANEEDDGSASYISVMVVRADSGIANLEQMRGRTLAWADPNSASGYLIPRFALRRQGIGVESGQYFSRTGFSGGHEQGIIAVLQRQYDAAVTHVSGFGEEARGFSRGNLRAMVDKGMLRMSDIRIVWRSGPIMNSPLVVRRDLPESFRRDMADFHLALPVAHRDTYRQIARGAGAGYREVGHADYEIFVEMRREEANERRRRS